MSWIVEDPWTIIGIGAFVELLLAVAFFNTRRGAVLVGMGGVLLVVLLGVLVEWLVVTEKEAAENAILAAAKAAESNDPQKLLAFVAPEAAEVRAAIENYIGWVQIRDVDIRGLDVKLDSGKPPHAIARFTAYVDADTKSLTLTHPNAPLLLEVTLRKEGDRWLVTKYKLRREL
jgi:hypothetical protein